MAADIERIIGDNDYLYGQNGSWRSYFEDLADFAHPRKAWINTIKSKGERLKFNFLYSSEAIRDVKICAAGFYSHLVNKAMQWFDMESLDPDLMRSHAVRKWKSETLHRMYFFLNLSNFDTTIQEYFLDKVVFGTSPFAMHKDYTHKVRFQNIPIEQVQIAENQYGIVDQMFRSFKWTARQAAERWGKNCCKAVSEAIEKKKSYNEIDFLHYVGPRSFRDVSMENNLNMPYESVWICKKGSGNDEATIVEESGYKRFPYLVGRFWKDANDPFAFSPTMDVFADVKTLNAAVKTVMRRAMKEAANAWSVPYKGFIAPLNFNPDAINTRKAGVPADAIQPLGVNTGNFSITEKVLDIFIQAIRDGLYVDLFNVLGNITKQMTVPEVQKKVADSSALLGPVVGREDYETLSPMLTNLYNMLLEDGVIDPPPSELEGQEVKWTFLGALVKMQKMSEVQPITSFMTIIGGMAQYKQDVVDKMDTDYAVDKIANILSVDPQLIRDMKQVDEIRKVRGEQQAQQAQIEMALKGAQASKMLAGAQKETALAGKG